MGEINCEVCERGLSFTWTDTHGVGVCMCCGVPYRIYHYDEDNKRIPDKAPVPAITKKGLEIAKQYWSEKGQMVYPGAFDMGFLGGREATYSGATANDIEAFNDWYTTHEMP